MENDKVGETEEKEAERKIFRFSKFVTIFCIVMLVLLTGKNCYLEIQGTPPDYLLAAAEYAPFGLELGFNAVIKILDKKKGKEDYCYE